EAVRAVTPVVDAAAEFHVADLPADRGFQVTVGEHGTHRIEVSRAELDRLDQAGVQRLAARALGHLRGEVVAAQGGRLGRLFRRLGRTDALVVDPVPGRHPRLSHADLAHAGEFDALARLHAASAGPARDALAADLGRFIERHGLRDGIPGADV